MVFEKRKGYSGYDLYVTDGTKTFSIIFAGNLDVYWTFNDVSTRERNGTFEITKENYKLYELFDVLYNSIKNCTVFDISDFDLSHCKSFDDVFKICEEKKNRYKKLSNWNELYCDGVVTWKCDDFPHDDNTNMVSIFKEEDKYVLKFEFNEKEHCFKSVRFRNNGSYYDPFNWLFMRMYNDFQEIDFEDPQIHIEEYLYEKKRVLK